MDQKIYAQRLKKLCKILQEHSQESLFITDAANLLYLSGFSASNGQLLITQKQTYLFTDFRYKEKAQKFAQTLGAKVILPQKGLAGELKALLKQENIKTLFFEEKNLVYKTYNNLKTNLKPLKLEPSKSFIQNLRMVKDELEITTIKKAQTVGDSVFKKLKTQLKNDMTEQEIAWEIEKIGREYKADDISFTPIVAFNENSAIPHHQPTAKKLKKGDLILIDMGMKYQHYCSDMTRMIFTKIPTAIQTKVYQTVLEAQLQAEKKIKAGIKGKQIDDLARKTIEQAGFKGKFGHSLGHGIGLEVHELPNLSPYYEEKLPVNSIVTIEPGIYLENNFGVRIEDMVLVLHQGSQNLTKSSKKIEDCLIKI